MEVNMTRRKMMFAVAIGIATFGSCYATWTAQAEDDAALIKALGSAKVSLQQGLTASQKEGQPISAKFELEDGKLQLSVYTAKDGKYSEVIVDYTTGKVVKSEPITEGEDLTHAKSQSAAIAKAKTQLKDAVDKATRVESGSKAVSATPEVKGGHSVASIELLKGTQLQTVTQPLD
jgi:uncharacterized membrane protein YkoI